MVTKNYNERPTRKILIALLDAPMKVEELTPLMSDQTAQEEIRYRHALVCLRYDGLIEDRADVWQLTEAGRDHAEWCREFPQRARRLKQDKMMVVPARDIQRAS